MSHLTVCLSPGEVRVEERTKEGRESGEPSCACSVRVAVDCCLAKHGEATRVAFPYFGRPYFNSVDSIIVGDWIAPPPSGTTWSMPHLGQWM